MKQDFSLPPAPKRPLGEVNIWLTSIGLSLGLIMIFGLLGIIVFNGLEAFWPKTVHELTIAPASQGEKPLVLYAGITKDQTRHMPADPALPGSMARDVREYQLFTGSKEAYGQSYRYVDAHHVTASSTPKGLLCLERMEGGKALVKPLELKLASGGTVPASSPEFMTAFRRALDREAELRDDIKAIDAKDIGAVNTGWRTPSWTSRPLNAPTTSGRKTDGARPRPGKTPSSRTWMIRQGNWTGSAPGWSSSTRNTPGTPPRRAG